MWKARFESGHHHGKITDAGLDDVVAIGHFDQFSIGQPHVDATVKDGDGGRRRTTRGHDGLDFSCHAEVLRPWQPMADDRRFQGYDGGT